MSRTVAEKLIAEHLVEGELQPGREIAIRFDQTLTQDATGTLVMQALEAMGVRTARTGKSVQYVDHNLLQEDNRNPEDHIFLQSACQRFGLWYSPPGGGVSHPVHMQYFGVPGQALIGSDSHTCAAGGLAMLAVGAGGLDVAMAIAGEPFWMKMPEVFGVRLEGQLSPWVSAKDVILEMLRRHGVRGAVGSIIEYHGPGVATLSAMDRHVIANMGAELGATTSVFPSDEQTRWYLQSVGRADGYRALDKDPDATFAKEDQIDLSTVQPLVALPSSPGNVVPVEEVAGLPIYQAYIGSSANPGYRDFAIAAEIVREQTIPPEVSFDINPTSRQLLSLLARSGHLDALVRAGARIHQAGCNGCIGMGQAPAVGRNSLRTVPRNFSGRSGTDEDRVFLCSPETAAVSALRGEITDPRELDRAYPLVPLPLDGPPKRVVSGAGPIAPPADEGASVEQLNATHPLIKGKNISSLPALGRLPDELELQILLSIGDDVSTDEILPAGSKVLPYRSNIKKIAEFSFRPIAEDYVRRARHLQAADGHAIIAGRNYGQGSSREHAALAPRSLGLRLVVAQSYARIHFDNLVNYGVLPLCFEDPSDRKRLEPGQKLRLVNLTRAMVEGWETLDVELAETKLQVRAPMSSRQRKLMLSGGLINHYREAA